MKNTASVSQEELVAFLSDPRSYPRRPKCVRVIQTHASYLLVAAPYVYKVKKPVNFGFLDFSTLEKRRHFCQREFLLNRRRSLILDATFSRRAHRDRLREQLENAGVPYCFVEAQASTELLKKRLREREGKSNEVSDARLEDFEMIDRAYEAPAELGVHRLVVVNTNRSLEATVTEASATLTQRSGRPRGHHKRRNGLDKSSGVKFPGPWLG